MSPANLRHSAPLGYAARLLAATLLAVLCVARTPRAESIDLGELTRETQQQHQDASKLEILWWLPVELWSAVLQGDPPGTTRSAALGNFDENLIFFVAEAKISPLGSLSFEPEAATRKHFRLIDTQGKRVAPLAEDDIPGDLRVLLNTLLPALAGSAGTVGQNFRPFVFKAKDASGARIANPRTPGQLRVELGERVFRWRLPLASLLPPKRCPVDGEELSGAFRYCPYHGNELEPIAPAEKP